MRKVGWPSTAAQRARCRFLGECAVSGERCRIGQAGPIVTHRNCTLDFVIVGSGPIGTRRRVQELRERLPPPKSRTDIRYAQLLELYLVYLINQEIENGSLKNIDLYDQKTAPLTPNSFIYNRHPFSQAGRRGFEPRLPLHLFNNLGEASNFLHSISLS